jgi:hypothetical protein
MADRVTDACSAPAVYRSDAVFLGDLVPFDVQFCSGIGIAVLRCGKQESIQ